MKLYFAGPLFTTPERTWNAEVTSALRAAGHEVFLPQEQEPDKYGARASSRPMWAGSTGRTARIDLPAASTTEVIAAILGTLARIEADGR